MIACYCAVRIFLSNVRILSVRKSLRLVRKWGGQPARTSSRGVQSWFQCRSLAKVTLMCWGTGGLALDVKCENVSRGGAQIKVDVPMNQGRSFTSFLQCIVLVFSLVFRACVLLLKFGPLFLVYPFTYLSSDFASLWLCFLLKVVESSGPTCIKLGQWTSTRRDLFSDEFCTKFSKLHVKVAPHPWNYTQHSLWEAFGEDWEKVFVFEGHEPVGSGCVAQVYKAYVDLSAFGAPVLKEFSKKSVLDSALEAWRVSGLSGLFQWLWKRKHGEVSEDHPLLHGDSFHQGVHWNSALGEQMPEYPSMPLSSSKRNHLIPVAIKVLHPGLVHQVQMDLFLMKNVSRFIELFPGLKWLSLTEIVEEFEKLMIQQIDLRYEARNLERFRRNFCDVDYVTFPIPLRPLVTRNILVETFEVRTLLQSRDGRLLRCFTQRIINVWNSLPRDVVTANNLDGFERGLDNFMEERSIISY